MKCKDCKGLGEIVEWDRELNHQIHGDCPSCGGVGTVCDACLGHGTILHSPNINEFSVQEVDCHVCGGTGEETQ